MAKQQMILVPEVWLKSILQHAIDFDEARLKLNIDNSTENFKLHLKAVALCGYAKSADVILKYNERVEK